MSSTKEKIKLFIQKYGKLALVTHIALSLGFYGLSYYLVSRGVDVKKYLIKIGINTSSSKFTSTAGTAALSYVVYKTTMPLRAPVTIGVVTLLVKIFKL
jgi:hypothetical protein